MDRGPSTELYSVLVSSPLFFTTWEPPKSLSQVISSPKRSRFGVKAGSKTSSHFGTGFFCFFLRFSYFFHTTSSASRIAPAISKPHFRLSSFLLFLLSLRLCFRRLFGSKWVLKRTPKRNPKLEPSKRRSGSEKRSHFPKRGSEMVPQKGRRCGVLFSFLLCCNFLLDFGAFRAYFER